MRPELIVFDVNETLSDLAPLGERFADVGAPTHLARTWFAGVLRDGFALTSVGATAPFADIAAQTLRGCLHGVVLDRSTDDAVDHVMAGFGDLPVHADVPDGIRALAGSGSRLVTLSNGSASVARALLDRAGVLDDVEALLSVEDAGAWKPAARAYGHALAACGIEDARAALLVAVHPWDIDGAARAGLSTAWIDRDGGPYPAHFATPDLTATSLLHLARQLD